MVTRGGARCQFRWKRVVPFRSSEVGTIGLLVEYEIRMRLRHAVIESMNLNSKSELAHLKLDWGMTNGHIAIEALADMGGFEVVPPEMRESTALGLALPPATAISLFGWDIMRPETLVDVNPARSTVFMPCTTAKERGRAWLAACCGALPWVDRDRLETAEE